MRSRKTAPEPAPEQSVAPDRSLTRGPVPHALGWAVVAGAIALFSPHASRADQNPTAPADASSSLITAGDIAREKPATVLELLRSRVGLDESNGTITMRGVRGVAVFVDGFASNVSELQTLKPEQVESIEILRGAASARFGAEAMGGAIAVTTRDGGKRRTAMIQGLDSRLGRHTRLDAGGGHEAADAGGRWSLLLEDRYHHDFRTVPDSPFAYQITIDDERSRSQQADGKVGWKNETVDTSLSVRRVDQWSYFGRPAWAFDSTTDTARARLSWQLGEQTGLDVSYGDERYRSAGSRDRGSGTDPEGLAPERWLTEKSRQREASLSVAFPLAPWTVHGGATRTRLTESFSDLDYQTRTLFTAADSSIVRDAVFVSGEAAVGKAQLELAVRHDLQHYLNARLYDASASPPSSASGGDTKNATSPKAALRYPLGSTYRLHGSLGTGFSPPLAAQLYSRYAGTGSITLANPALKAERSVTFDLGLERKREASTVSLTLFATRWLDKIGTRIVDYGEPVVQQVQNIGEARAYGLESQWVLELSRSWTLNTNYTYTATRIVRDLGAPELVGNALPNLPRHKANLTIDHKRESGLSVRGIVRLVGSSYTDEANTVLDDKGYRWKKPAYAVVDLNSGYRQAHWELTLSLHNALNRDYVTGFFWHGEPRTWRGELILRF